tara:strand:+ start:1792 stop:2340 length:549 start_codon:yes stop_codon:yes gene_type:complete
MEIKDTPIEDLKTDPFNVREHDEANIKAIAKSLQEFGQQKPIVINSEGIVIAGNGTLGAAMSLGWESIKTVKTRLANEEAVAFAIADNRTAELAVWDEESLAQVLDQLDEPLRDATGFSEEDFRLLLAKLEPWGDGMDNGTESDEDIAELEAKIGVTCREVDRAKIVDKIRKAVEGLNVKVK